MYFNNRGFVLYRKFLARSVQYAVLEIFMAMKVQVVVFWVLASCRGEVRYQRFRGPCCLYFQGDMKMAATRSSKILVSYHITTWCQKPEDHNLKCSL
jgi:hypothetical protein